MLTYMGDEETIDFREHAFNCPYCGQVTILEVPAQIDQILAARADCQQCGRDFLIENDVPSGLPQ
jgi:transcription elongation factor Elf1